MTTVVLHAHLLAGTDRTPQQWGDELTAQLPGVTVAVAPHGPGEVFLLLEPDHADPASDIDALHEAAARLLADPSHFELAAVLPTGDLSS